MFIGREFTPLLPFLVRFPGQTGLGFRRKLGQESGAKWARLRGAVRGKTKALESPQRRGSMANRRLPVRKINFPDRKVGDLGKVA